jgi:YD repeat-containing protein
MALIDAAGATVQSYSYDAYGQLTSAVPTIENPFRYAGQYTDDATVPVSPRPLRRPMTIGASSNPEVVVAPVHRES